MTVTIPGLGTLANPEADWLTSEPVQVRALGTHCTFMVDGFEDAGAAGLAASVESFLAMTGDDLRREAGEHVWAYYSDFAAHYSGEPGFPTISEVGDVWDFVTFGSEVWVRPDGPHWYFSVENECAWEPEHGLDLVLKDGRQVTKVGQVDGHFTNRSAYGESIPDDTVYVSPF